MTPLLSAFSAALLHFAWQGCVVLALLWTALFVLRNRAANTRYLAGCLALALLAAAPAITTYVLYHAPAAGPSLLAGVAPLPLPAGAVAPGVPTGRTALLAALQSWALPAWALGVLLFSVRMVWGGLQVAALRRRGQPPEDAVLAMAASLSRRMGLAGHARVLVSAWAGGPSLVGWLRPVILLPASALSSLTPQQLEAILAHELAHIRRHDYLVNCMQMVVETLLFYHPAVWWISARIRHERELCCDDLAVGACAGPLCYARALTVLERMRAAAPATALGSTDGALSYRIRRIVGAATQHSGPSRASVVVALALALLGVAFSVNWARAQSRPPADYLAQGDQLLRTGANEPALQQYLAGMSADPVNRAAYQKRSIEALIRMGRRQQAAEINAQLLTEHPDDIDAMEFRASVVLDQGNIEAAFDQLKQVLERAPDNPVAHFDLGRAFAVQGKIAAARREIETAIHLRPDFERAKEELERLNPVTPAPAGDESLALLQSESARNPERLDLALALGNAALRADKLDLAVFQFQRVLDRMDPGNQDRGELYLRLGETYRRKGDALAAVQALEKARELLPHNRAVIGPLLLALEAAGLRSEAGNLRAEAELTQKVQTAMTANFLKDELASERKRLETLRAQPQPDTEAIRQAESRLVELQSKTRLVEASDPAGRVLAGIYVAGIPEASKRGLQLPVHLGDILTLDAIAATHSAVKLFDQSLNASFTLTGDNQVRLTITPRR